MSGRWQFPRAFPAYRVKGDCRLAPNAYAHARYTYSFVQRLHDIRLDRSSAELEVGYLITPAVSVRALANWLNTHGGIGFWEAYEDLLVFLAHDRLLATRYWQVGGGATAALTDSIDLEGAFVKAVSGGDSHTGFGVSVGLTWRFLDARTAAAPGPARRRDDNRPAHRAHEARRPAGIEAPFQPRAR